MVLNSVNYTEGKTIQERIRNASIRSFNDPYTGVMHQFTPRTISTWLYRHKVNGLTTITNKTRSDKNQHRKVQPAELAEAIKEVFPTIKLNKVGRSLKSAVFRCLFERGLFEKSQLSQTQFYRLVREHELMNIESTQKLRQSFAMRFANELWQADTMHGPTIKTAESKNTPSLFSHWGVEKETVPFSYLLCHHFLCLKNTPSLFSFFFYLFLSVKEILN